MTCAQKSLLRVRACFPAVGVCKSNIQCVRRPRFLMGCTTFSRADIILPSCLDWANTIKVNYMVIYLVIKYVI